jgi:hypothetical protein
MVARDCRVFVVLSLLAVGCGGPSIEETSEVDPSDVHAEVDESPSDLSAAPTTVTWSFAGGAQGWSGGYSDYTRGMEANIGFQSGWSSLPAPLTGKGFKLSGNNASDDLWMFGARVLTRAEHGIQPNAVYDVTMTAWIASNAPSGCLGTGGAPGESVWLKGNIVATQPRTFVDGDEVLFNIAKGNQSEIGSQALSFGDLANGDSCDDPPRYKILVRSATRPTPVRATSTGKLWVYFGSDSGFESRSTYYLDQVRVTLTRR